MRVYGVEWFRGCLGEEIERGFWAWWLAVAYDFFLDMIGGYLQLGASSISRAALEPGLTGAGHAFTLSFWSVLLRNLVSVMVITHITAAGLCHTLRNAQHAYPYHRAYFSTHVNLSTTPLLLYIPFSAAQTFQTPLRLPALPDDPSPLLQHVGEQNVDTRNVNRQYGPKRNAIFLPDATRQWDGTVHKPALA